MVATGRSDGVFFNAWQITKDDNFLNRSVSSRKFIQHHIPDKRNGEWLWGIKKDDRVMTADKAGIRKCPYHNSRACMELIGRIQKETAID